MSSPAKLTDTQRAILFEASKRKDRVARFKAKGEISPAPTGGDRRSGRIEAHRDYLLGLIRRRPDMTLLEMQERLIANCGERFSSSVLWRFFDRHEITFKKPVAGRGPPVAVETELIS